MENRNTEYLGLTHRLCTLINTPDPKLRGESVKAIRELVVQNEKLLAQLERREIPSWVAEVEESTLPQYRVKMTTKSGSKQQVTEHVRLHTAETNEDAIQFLAFKKLKSDLYPDIDYGQWLFESVSLVDLFAST